jgi:anthranilate phosphoribosyltransferase
MNTNLQETLARLMSGSQGSLNIPEAEELFTAILTNPEIPDGLIGAILVALRVKKETFPELIGAARAIKAVGGYPDLNLRTDIMDICGTGSDGARTVNISTAAAFVVAAAETCLPVAKHCGGSSSGGSGSVDVLGALGVPMATTMEEAREHLEKHRLCFLKALSFHPMLEHVNVVRRGLGVGTIFNLALPLVNPLGVAVQLIGVPDHRMGRMVLEAAKQTGSRRIGVLLGPGGVDEATLDGDGETDIFEMMFSVDRQQLGSTKHQFTPAHFPAFGMQASPNDHLRVENAAQSAMRIRAVLNGETGALSDVIALNAGFALYLGGAQPSWFEGIRHAKELLADGSARAVFESMTA